MVVFDQLRVSDDGTALFIDVHVSNIDGYESFYLDTLVIKTAEQVSELSSNVSTGDNIYQHTFDGNQKEAHLVLHASDFNTEYTLPGMSKTLFFVYINCKSVGSTDLCYECLPCSMQSTEDVGVTFDTTLFYQAVMQYTRELAATCTIPKGLIDMTLLWSGFKASVETEHFLPAIDFWKKIFGAGASISSSTTFKGCGCHG